MILYAPSTQRTAVDVDIRPWPGVFRTVTLIQTAAGRCIRFDGDEYPIDRGDWLDFPLSPDQAAELYDAVSRAGVVLDALLAARR